MAYPTGKLKRRRLDRHFPGTALLRVSIAWLLVTLATCYVPAGAAELVLAHVSSRDDIYSIRTEVLLAGEPSQVRDMLIEYRRLSSLNPNIEHVVPLPEAQDGGLRLQLHARACFLLVCQRYRWVQRVEYLPDGQVFAVVEPSESDFDYGWFRYRFVPDGEQCRLIVEAQLAPTDGVSNNRLVRAVMKRVLADEAVTLASRLEGVLSSLSRPHGPLPGTTG